MKQVFLIVLTPIENGSYFVDIPDLNINTEGSNLVDAINMARDAIGMWGVYEQDSKRNIPNPSSIFINHSDNQITTLVDIDFDEYRRKNDNKTVRKNLTIPNWLNIEAEEAGINFSKVLQEALIEKLQVN